MRRARVHAVLVPHPSTWPTYERRWTDSLRAAGRPETTIYLRRYHLRRLARETGHNPVTLTGDDLIRWAAAHRWSRDTRRSVRSSLRSFYTWLHDTGERHDNPAHVLGIVRPQEPRPHPAPRGAIRDALTRATPHQRLAIRLAAEHGLRRGEVAIVHHRDLREDLLGWTLIVHGKGGKDRAVPLSDDLTALLRATAHAGNGYVFPGQINGHISPATLGKQISALLPDGVTMHSLRHSFATTTYHETGDLLAVQILLGHASPATTQRYVQVPTQRLRAVTETARVA